MPALVPGLAFGVVSSMAFATVANAAGLDNYPADPAEAASSIIDTSILGQELAGAGHAEAGYPTSPGPNNKGLELDLLGSEVIDLGGIQLPITELIDYGQLGALQSTSTATGPRDAEAITGLVGADGSISLDGTDAQFGSAEIKLLSVFDELGLSSLTDLGIDRADLRLGAGGAHVQAVDGVFQDPDGNGTGLGQYRAGEASLLLHSQAVDDLAATLYNSIGQIDTTMEQQVNQLLSLTDILAALPAGATLNATVESNMQEEIFQAILAQPITSKNEVLTIDFSTGTIEIHLDKAFSNELRPGVLDGINNQPPNTELVDDQLYPIVAGTIHDLIEEVVNVAVGAIGGALGSVTVHFEAGLNVPLAGGATVTWDVNLMGEQIAAPTCTPSGIGGAGVCTTLMTAVGLLSPIVNNALVPVRDFILSDGGQQVFDLAIRDIKTNAMTVPIRAILEPFIEAIAQVISLQINHQVQGTCTAADGSTHVNSLEVSAISLGLLQGVGADGGARLNFGHAGVRVDACNLAVVTPTLQATSPVPAGGSSAITSGGWAPNSPVTLQLTDPNGAPVGVPVQVTTDANGNVPAGTTVPVPANAAPGDYTVVGTDASNNRAEAPLAVYSPTLQATSPTAPGECSAITSGGWQPNSPVTLQLTDANGNPVGAPVQVTTDANGNVPAGTCVPVPAGTAPGEYTVVGTDPNGANVTAPLTVSDAAIAPTVQASSPVPAGGSSDITSGGWAPNSPVTFQLTDPNGAPVGAPVPVTTDANGNVPVGTTVPVPADAAPGEYTVVGTDPSNNRAEAPVSVYSPTLQAQSPTAAGQCSAITSGGWQPNSPVSLQLTDANGNPVGAPVVVTTDANGAVPAGTCVTVPAGTAPGDYTVVGTDGNGARVTAPLTVTEGAIAPTLQAESPVPAGGSSDLTSGGWAPNSPVTFQLTDPNGAPVGAPVPVTTDANGAIPAGTTLPVPADAAPGDYTVVGTDAENNRAEAPLSVYAPTISATSPVQPGSSTDITSGGWQPNSPVTLSLRDANGNPVQSMQVTTDANGAVPADTKLPIPAGTAPGDYTVVGTDPAGATAQAPVQVVAAPAPTLQAESPVPAGGSSDLASGGWLPGIQIGFQLTDPNGAPVGDPVFVTTDANGDAPAGTTLPVPANATAGEYTVVGTDANGNRAEAPVTVYAPSISATSPVPAGGSTDVTSGGWLPNSAVTLQLTDANGNPVGAPAQVTTDANGAVPAGTQLPVPADATPGPHSVVGTDAGGARVSAPVEVTAPVGAPTLQAESPVPAGGSSDLTSGGWAPNSPVTFQLTDPNGAPVGAPVPVTTDANGAVPAGTTVPVPANAPAGDYTVVGTGPDNTRAEAPVAVYAPALTATSPVPAGGSSDITSGGWLPNTPVTLQLTDANGNPVGAPVQVTTDANGDVPAGTTVPVPAGTAPGEYTIVGTDDNGARATAPLTVGDAAITPTLQASSPVPAGGSSDLTSDGWKPNSPVSFQLVDPNGAPVGAPVQVTTDANGAIPAGTTLPVPANATAGDYTAVGTDADGNRAEAPVVVYAPSIAATSPIPAGGSTEVTSAGWLPNSQVALQLADANGNPVGAPVQVTTDANGAIPAGTTLPVPANATAGAHTVTGVDQNGTRVQAPVVVYAPTLQAASPTAPGECSAITSGGWQPNTQVTLQLTDANGNPVGAPVVVTTDANGDVPAGTCVPVPAGTAPGDYTVVGTDPNGAEITAPITVGDQAVAPTLQVTSPVAAGDATDVTSGGWAPNAPVSFQLVDANGNPVGAPVQATTDANGNVPAGTQVPVPADATAGDHKVVGTDADGNRVEAPLVVYTPALQAQSPTAAGECSAITSGGWQPNSTVTLQLTDANGNPVGAPVIVTTDAGGSVPADTCVTVPAGTAPGGYEIVGTDGNGGEATAPVSVYAPSISATSPVPAGGSTEVTSAGWLPNGQVTLQLKDANGNPVGEAVVVTTDANGAIPAATTLAVPADATPGAFTVSGVDAGGVEVQAAIEVTAASAAPSVSATSPVPAGASTEITSGGWAANSPVSFQLVDANGNPVGAPVQVTTDANGAAPAGTTVPVPANAAAGAYRVIGSDEDGRQASAPVAVYAPSIAATSPVPAGGATEITSGGWLPSSQVTLQLVNAAGAPVGAATTVTTDVNGDVPAATTLAVPADAAAGAYAAVGTDAGGARVSAPVEVLAAGTAPVVQATSPIPAGHSTSITSSGWLANTAVSFQLVDANGNPVGAPVAVTTDANGAVAAGTTLAVPANAAAGTYRVVGTEAGGRQASAPVAVYAPSISADSPVPAGTSSAVTSGGWLPNTDVVLQLTDANGNHVGAALTVTTDAAGNVPAGVTVRIPATTTPGVYGLTGTDANGATASTQIQVTAAVGAVCADPKVTVTPNRAKAGETVTVTGTGFAAGSTANVQLYDKHGNALLTPAVSVKVGNECGFSVKVTIPGSAQPGDHTVTVTDGDGNKASAKLTVGDFLAVTGADLGLYIPVGLLLLLAGAGAYIVHRRKQLQG